MTTLADLEYFVEQQGGKIHNPSEYKNNTTRITFICKEGHRFIMTPAIAKRDWCRKCSREEIRGSRVKCPSGKHDLPWKWTGPCKYCESELQEVSTGEEMVRSVFTSVFGVPFPRTYPNWLLGESSYGYGGSRILLLDGYNHTLKLAFDYNPRDESILEEKRRKCDEHGVELIVIPYVSLSTLRDYTLGVALECKNRRSL